MINSTIRLLTKIQKEIGAYNQIYNLASRLKIMVGNWQNLLGHKSTRHKDFHLLKISHPYLYGQIHVTGKNYHFLNIHTNYVHFKVLQFTHGDDPFHPEQDLTPPPLRFNPFKKGERTITNFEDLGSHQPPVIILNFAPQCENLFNKTSRRMANHFTSERIN